MLVDHSICKLKRHPRFRVRARVEQDGEPLSTVSLALAPSIETLQGLLLALVYQQFLVHLKDATISQNFMPQHQHPTIRAYVNRSPFFGTDRTASSSHTSMCCTFEVVQSPKIHFNDH